MGIKASGGIKSYNDFDKMVKAGASRIGTSLSIKLLKNMPELIKRGQELELDIESLAYGGMGIAKKDNFVIFVKNAIPGQKVFARVYKKRKRLC